MNNTTESITPKLPTKLYGLENLRAFAITFVIIFHYGHVFTSPQWINSNGKFGWSGVDLFFVLSGYLISSQLFADIARGKNISFKTFFIKRFFRIIPAYMAIVAIYFCFPAARERSMLAPLWKYLTFTQNIGLDITKQGTFSHAWSLCIEEQFYLLLPLILMALVYFKANKKGFVLMIALFVLGFAARWYIYQTIVLPGFEEEGGWITWFKWIYYPTYGRLDGLLTGVGIAALFQFRPLLKEKISAYGNLFLTAGLIVLTGAYFICIHEQSFEASIFGFPLVSIGYGLLVMGAISPTCFLYKFKSGVTYWLATLSFGIYLSHKIIIHITQVQFSKLNIAVNSNLMFLICMITCFAGALLLNIAIEKPFLRLREKILVK